MMKVRRVTVIVAVCTRGELKCNDNVSQYSFISCVCVFCSMCFIAAVCWAQVLKNHVAQKLIDRKLKFQNINFAALTEISSY